MPYSPTTWLTGDVITATRLNNAEQGIADAMRKDGSEPMTGALTLNADPINSLNPVTKQYMESFGIGKGYNAVPNDDLNDISASGIYSTISTTSNTPPLGGSGSAVLAMVYDANAQTQLYLGRSGDVMYYRRKSSGVWQPWVGVITTTGGQEINGMLTLTEHIRIKASGGFGILFTDSDGLEDDMSIYYDRNTDSIFFRDSAGSASRFAIPKVGFNSSYNNFQVSNGAPRLSLYEDDQGLNLKRWDFIATGGIFQLRSINDSNTAASVAMEVRRNDYNVDEIQFNTKTLFSNGTFDEHIIVKRNTAQWSISITGDTVDQLTFVSSGTKSPLVQLNNVNYEMFHEGNRDSGAKVIPMYQDTGAVTTDSTSYETVSASNPRFNVTKLLWDGELGNNRTIYFEVLGYANSGVIGYYELYNLTDGTSVVEITTTSSTSCTRVRSSSISLTDGKEYIVRFKSSSGAHTIGIHVARLVII